MADTNAQDKSAQDKSVEVLLKLIGEYWGEIHHIEGQRSALTNILLVIESAAIALVVQSKYSPASLPLPILLTLVGGIGVLATRKYHERFCYAQARLTEWYRTVDGLCPATHLMENLRKANKQHEADRRLLLFNRYHLIRIPLHRLWIWIHVAFVFTGIALTAVVLISSFDHEDRRPAPHGNRGVHAAGPPDTRTGGVTALGPRSPRRGP